MLPFKFDNLKESFQIEGKKAENALPKSIWETYSSFCNTLGGYIILGVEENNDGYLIPYGIQNSYVLLKDIWSTLNNKQKVSVNLLTEDDIQIRVIDDKEVIIIHVPMASREFKPVYINNNLLSGTYRRNNDGDYHCTQLEINNMLRDQSDKTQDYRIIEKYSLKQVNWDTLKSYREKFKQHFKEHSWNKLEDQEFLYRINAMDVDNDGEYHLTEAGLLMFGNDYEIEKEIPNYFIDYQEHMNNTTRWSNRFHSGEGTWSGNLHDFFFRTLPLLSSAFQTPFCLDSSGKRQAESKAVVAVREALLNCISNANFYDVYGLVIKRYQNKLIFENPGVLRIPVEKAIQGGYSDPRNKVILKMFSLIGYGERAGSGIPEIYAIWNDNNWPAPQIEQEFNHDRTRLIMEYLNTNPETDAFLAHPSYRTVYEYLQHHKQAKTKDIAVLLNVKDARARQILKQMIEMRLVTALGSNRNRVYRLYE